MAGDDVTVGKVNVELTGDSSKLEAAAKKGEDALKKFDAKTTQTGSSLSKLSQTMQGSGDQLRALANAAGISTDAMDRVENRVSNLARATDDATGIFSGMSRAVLIGAAAFAVTVGASVAAAAAITSTTLEMARLAEEQDHLAQRTGISVRTQQEWSVTMAENNFSAQSFTAAMRTLSKNVIDARDASSESAQMFRTLGITSTDTSEIIRQVADTFATMEDGAQKARIANQLFGRSGLELIPILNKGSAEFEKSARLAREYGLVLSKDQVQALKDVDDAYDRLGASIQGFKTQIAVVFADSVQFAIEKLTEWIVTAQKAVTIMGKMRDDFVFAPSSVPSPNQGPQPAPKGTPGATRILPAPSGIVQGQMADALGPGQSKFEAPEALAQSFARGTESLGGFLAQMRTLQKTGVLTQEQLGQAILEHTQRYDIATEHAKQFAEAAVGKTLVEMEQRQAKERGENLANMLEGGQRVVDLENQKLIAYQQGNFAEAEAVQLQIEEVQAITDADRAQREKISSGFTGYQFLQQKLNDAYNDERRGILTNRAIRDGAFAKQQEDMSAVQAVADQMYQQERGLLDSSEAARATAFSALDARYEQSSDLLRDKLNDKEILESEYNRRMINLDLHTQAERMAILQRYPTFFEGQMQQLIQSNVFSLAQITSNFTNSAAQWIVTGKGFEQFWTQLQVTMVQAFLNTLVQLFANWALHTSLMEGASTAYEAAKTAIFGAGETSRLGIAKATNVAIAGGTVAALGAMVAMGEGAVAIMSAVMLAASAMMAAIAGALAAGIVTAELAPAVAAASGALAVGAGTMAAGASGAIQAAAGAAIAAGSIAAFAKGGIATGPTMGLVGEAGSSEAIIPLNSHGADFMADMLGLGNNSKQPITQHISVELNGRVIAEAVADDLPSILNLQGVPAI